MSTRSLFIIGSLSTLLFIGAGCSSANTITADTNTAPTTTSAQQPAPSTQPDATNAAANTNSGVMVKTNVNAGVNAATNVNTNTSATVAVKKFVVTGQNFSFAPSSMTVKKGDTVSITFKNAQGFHDLRIDELGVATKKIGAAQEETVTFVASKTGSFEYYCSVGEHRALGMKGTLTVE